MALFSAGYYHSALLVNLASNGSQPSYMDYGNRLQIRLLLSVSATSGAVHLPSSINLGLVLTGTLLLALRSQFLRILFIPLHHSLPIP